MNGSPASAAPAGARFGRARVRGVPRVSAVVPSYRTPEELARCLAAVERARGELHSDSGGELELIVVDDASRDGSAEWVGATHPRARIVVHARNLGFTAAVNRGLALARGEYALLLNADCELAPGALVRLARFLDASPAHAAAAPRLVDAAGRTLASCMNLPRLATALWHGTPLERLFPRAREPRRYFAREFDHEVEADVEQPPAACLLVRRRLLEELGGLDPRMELYFSDVDLSRRLADAGWRTRYLPAAEARHAVGCSTRQRPDRLLRWHLDRLEYYRRHHGALAGPLVKLCALAQAADQLFAGHVRARELWPDVRTFLAA